MAGFQTPITIKQAIDRIRSKAYLLPAFQREYVWKSAQVENLFDSLMKGYPISSMLFWKVKGDAKNSYKFYQVLDRFIERYHVHNDPFDTNQINDFHAVLDGQQRLTSLYLGLCGSYAFHKYRTSWEDGEAHFPTRVLYLNISREFPEDENDKTYNFSFKELAVTKGDDLYTDTVGDHWFRVSKILDLGDGDSEYDIDDFADDHDLQRSEKKMLNKLKTKIFNVQSINFYEIEDSSPDVAVNIFVRINSGGTPLSFSNILMSMAIAGWTTKDARTEILRLVDTVNNKGFNINQDFVLKAFLYLFKNDVRFRIKSFDNDFINLVENRWEGIRDCIEELFELMRSYGLNAQSLTSNNATLPILYYLYHRNIYSNYVSSIQYAQDREKVRIWLMKTLIFRSFGNSGDRILQASHRAFTDDILTKYISEDITEFPSEIISSSIKQQSELTDEFIDNHILSIHKDNGYAFAILSLLYSNLDYRNLFHKDHLHPYALCEAAGYDWHVYDTILNLQMLDANENMSKNDKPLIDWVKDETNAETRAQFLKSHLIPNVDLSLDNFDEFIVERRKLLHTKIRSIFNYSSPTANTGIAIDDDDYQDVDDDQEPDFELVTQN
jgi:uncharacterized protein with ParB-like and HNH nuclease domain